MLDDAFANFEGQVEPAECGVAQFEVFYNAQRVQVVIKEVAVRPHRDVERFFAGMAERRMADVVNQSEGFDQIDVQAELSGDGAGDLRDFNACGSGDCESGRSSGG